jgi:hypothetical protein
MFLEVSAKSAYNVEEAFTSSAKQILQNIGTKAENPKEKEDVRII